MNVEPGWPLLLALVLLAMLGTGALLLGRVSIAKQVPWAGIRAGIQLLLISYVVGWAVSSPFWAFALVGVMFTVGVITTSRRVGLDSPRSWGAAALAMAAGALPVLAIIFGTGAAPLEFMDHALQPSCSRGPDLPLRSVRSPPRARIPAPGVDP